MSRTFQDHNFLVWEAFPSSGRFGYSERPHIVFHCLTLKNLRPRFVSHDGDAADAARTVERSTSAELLELLGRSQEVS